MMCDFLNKIKKDNLSNSINVKMESINVVINKNMTTLIKNKLSFLMSTDF